MGSENSMFNAIEVATDPKGFVGLKRDEKAEMKALRETLLKLTAFQIRFVENYIRTASPAKSAELAGSQSSSPDVVGYKTLQNPDVQRAIAIAMKKRIEAVGLDTVEVIQKTREVYDAAMMAGKFEAANKACELLMKQIELASKIGSVNLTATQTRASKELLNKNEVKVDEGEIERVLGLLSRKPVKDDTQSEISETNPLTNTLEAPIN